MKDKDAKLLEEAYKQIGEAFPSPRIGLEF